MLKCLVMVVNLVVLAVLCGCAAPQAAVQAKLPDNAKVLLIKPDKDFICPQMDRLTCIDYVQPSVKDVPHLPSDGTMDWFKRVNKVRLEAMQAKLKEVGADVEILTGDRVVEQSFGGVTFDFVSAIALNILAGKAGASAGSMTKSSLTGASQGTAINANNSNDSGIVVNNQPGNWRMFAMLAGGASEGINCPKGVENDPKACLSVLAQALVAGTAK